MRTYTFDEVSRLLEERVGVTASVKQLREAEGRIARGLPHRRGATAGIPIAASVPADHGHTRVFIADEVDAWLGVHPLAADGAPAETENRFRQRWAAGDTTEAVAGARASGLSWREIAELIGALTGEQVTLAWVYGRYGPTRAGRTRQEQPVLPAPRPDRTPLAAAVAVTIAELRQAAGLTQTQLSARAGLFPSAIDAIEAQHRGIGLDQLGDIATALHLPPSELLRRAEAKLAQPEPEREGRGGVRDDS